MFLSQILLIMQVIGHRGAAALAPENTWESFDRALSIGVDAIETDVHSTSDGEFVLIHDKNLSRTTNGTGIVHDTPWSIVKELDAGSWFSEEHTGARIPRLRETLERYGQQTHIVLEVKQAGIELQVLEMVREMGLLENVTFSSFFFTIVENLKSHAPEAKVGSLTIDAKPETTQRVLDAKLDQICPPAPFLSQELVKGWKASGLEVRAWGIKDPDVMRIAIEAGVDGMTVDFPHLLLEAVGRPANL